ncbi:uncharacterized protein LOC108037110 [Drosophila rhopaloa]|uniref:Uncharacterized protein LOC108037110 n=1 Tax=Drosophila rhopaloa TaxID=1041015 RepID=A0A6P4DU82_DRORH|nr:uncharacterized protein LOC108037110 [Drosophila rhopaloa]
MLVKVLMLALLAVLSQAKPQLLVTTPVSYATGAGGAWLAPSSAYYPSYAYASYPAYAAYAYAPVYGAYASYPYYPYLRR